MNFSTTIPRLIAVILLLKTALLISCSEESKGIISKYKYHRPKYDLVQLKITQDTISFPLNEYTYNAIKSFNLFTHKNIEFISFYDEGSASINIYPLHSKNLKKKISLKKCFKNKTLYKTTAYTKNFDSIFVTNKNKLYMMDSSGNIKLSIDFLENTRLAYASFENGYTPLFEGNMLYMGIRPYVDDDSFKALRKWKILYGFDLKNKKAKLYYHLPPIYHENLYGYQFLDYSYCYNNKGNFVFSFPADTNIYESNLADYHVAFYGKSREQTNPIQPLTKKQVDDSEESFRLYITQDSYGSIYFDPYHKRYLRVVKSKISEEDYEAKNRKREYRFIIFNEQLQIVGECPVPEGMSYSSLFFTKEGGFYARVNAQDEYALHFVRLEYQEKNEESFHLTRVDKNLTR